MLLNSKSEYPCAVPLFSQEGIIGNRVKIPSDPVTVSDERAAVCHCESEKARPVWKREPGNLLYMVWIGIFRRKHPCLARSRKVSLVAFYCVAQVPLSTESGTFLSDINLTVFYGRGP